MSAEAVARSSVVVVRKTRFSETMNWVNAKFCGKVAINYISRPFFPFFKFGFLAQLDYVSRAHEIEIRPSVVCPSVASIISDVTSWISFKF